MRQLPLLNELADSLCYLCVRYYLRQVVRSILLHEWQVRHRRRRNERISLVDLHLNRVPQIYYYI